MTHAAHRRWLVVAAILVMTAPIPAQTLYWDSPAVLDRQGVRWSSSATSAGTAILVWQEIVPTAGKNEGVIYLSGATSVDGTTWTFVRRFLGPIKYSGVNPGQEPQFYSMAVNGSGRVLVAALTAEKEITVLSADRTLAFQTIAKISTPLTAVTLSLFTTRTDGLLLFTTQSAVSATAPTESTLSWSFSQDGKTWAPFASFVTAGDMAAGIQLQPDHIVASGKDIVVFQSQPLTGVSSQIFLRTSADGGSTWGPTQAITGLPLFNEQVGTVIHPPGEFNNARPRLFANGPGLTLLWERYLLGAESPSLYSMALDANGQSAGPFQSLTPGSSSIFGQIITLGSRNFLLYAQNIGATSRVILSEKTGDTWNPTVVGRALGGSSQFPHAIVLNGALHLFWENGPAVVTSGADSTLVELRPKTSVLAPTLIPVGFTPGKPEKSDSATIRWSQPADPVGIDAYEVTMRLNGTIVPPVHRVNAEPDSPVTTFPFQFPRDGAWRFEVVAIDIAQNRSPPATMDFIRDTTPPHPVVLAPVQTDPDGYLPANSFTVSWSAPPDNDLAGYSWEEQSGWATLADYQSAKTPLHAPPARVMTTATSLSFSNLENGVHVVTVAAVDAAGNLSAPAQVTVLLDKFRPFTAVYALVQKADDQGNITVSLRGRGFLTNGTLQQIFLSRTGNAPYDRVILPGAGGFRVVSDTLVTGLVLDNTFASGTYRVGFLQPPAAPWFWTGGSISFESPGTVHFGSLAVRVPRWLAGSSPRYDVSFNSLLLGMVVAMLAVLLVFSIRRMASLAQEGALLRGEITALLEGRPAAGWAERNRVMQELKKRNVSLRRKFTILIVALVFIVVLIVSIPLGVRMIGDSRRSLALELQKRSVMLISTMAANAEVEIQKGTDIINGGLVTIASVPNNISQMAEAQWATVTGPGAGTSDTASREYVWASNEEKYKSQMKLNQFAAATEPANDAVSPLIPKLQQSVDDAAHATLKDVVDKYQALRDRYDALNAKKTRTAAENAELKAVLQGLTPAKDAINAGAKDMAEARFNSLPPFDPNNLAPSYLFYKPIVYYNTDDKSLYQGLVRMQVDTKTITDQILANRDALVISTGIIALIAIGLGVLGAIIMASITITPIRKLAQGVTFIGSTEDKEELKEYSIAIRSRDEIGQLADTVNDMTRGLVKAAIANKELMLGKDVQKMFLPLEKDSAGRKGSTAGTDTGEVEIYGYYEGAKEVSGDYFDFRKLDATHYAIIKCDVSGHGVSAGLIMVEVATLFISHFREWQRRKESLGQVKDVGERKRILRELERLDTLVYTINDMIEERGFKGLFAAFTLGILDTATGEISACPAGDKEIHIYDVSEKRMVHSKFTDGEGSPAAGAFASMLVEMKSGFPQFPIHLDHGDVLFLPTDGFDEAKRSLRDDSFEVVTCQEPGLKEGEFHLTTHKLGDNTEDFGQARMDDFVTGVFNRRRVNLVRHHNPVPDEVLEFDFSGCEGTVREAVLALVSAEKLFRLVANPKAGDGDRVVVDAKIDAFLAKHFVQYPAYFAHRLEGQPGDAYVHFSHLMEDEQRDDLTILVMRRK